MFVLFLFDFRWVIWFHGHHSRAHYFQIVIECLPYVRYFSRCQDYIEEQVALEAYTKRTYCNLEVQERHPQEETEIKNINKK